MSTALIAGWYEMGPAIGSGATGIVYLGWDVRSGERVAIKTVRRELLAGSPELAARFACEAQALSKLRHPNVTRLLAGDVDGDECYLVMEYAAGGSIFDLLQRQPQLRLDRVVAIGLGVASALAQVHRLGILHRDIKPSNILLAAGGTPRLTDFGLARLGSSTTLTTAESLLGTFQYVSPEAWHKGKLDERADIWSLGVVLYEMLAGARPFDGDTPYEIMWAINNDPLPDLCTYRDDVPAGLADLIRRMLMRDVAARVSGARLVEEELRCVENDRRGARPASQLGGGLALAGEPASVRRAGPKGTVSVRRIGGNVKRRGRPSANHTRMGLRRCAATPGECAAYAAGDHILPLACNACGAPVPG
jgi:serine/threonine-protein kinase